MRAKRNKKRVVPKCEYCGKSRWEEAGPHPSVPAHSMLPVGNGIGPKT